MGQEALEQSQAKVTGSLGTQHGIFPLDLALIPCCYSVTPGEPEEFLWLGIREEC